MAVKATDTHRAIDAFEEARAEFERAASLTRNSRERDLLLERANAASRGERR